MKQSTPDTIVRLRRLNAILRAINNVNQLILSEKDRRQLIRNACKLLTGAEGFLNACIILFDTNGNYLDAAQAGVGKDFNALKKQLKMGERNYCIRQALSHEGVVTIEDPDRQCSNCPLNKNYVGLGGFSKRLQHEEKVFGTITVSVNQDFLSDSEAQKLFEEVGGYIAFALHSINLDEERRMTEDALRENDKKFRTIFENVNDVIINVDALGKVIDVNRRIEDIYGYNPEEVIGKNFSNLGWFGVRDLPKILKLFKEALKGKITDLMELEVKHQDGHTIYVEVSNQPVRENGRIVGFLSIVRDITERKQSEARIRQERETLVLVNALNQAAYREDSLDKIIGVFDRLTSETFSTYSITIYLLSQDKEYLVMQNLSLPPNQTRSIEKLIGMDIPKVRIRLVAESAYAEILHSGKPRITNDPAAIRKMMAECTENKALRKLVPAISRILNFRSVMSVPLVVDNEPIGLIDVSLQEPFSESDLERFATIARQLASILKYKQVEKTLKESEDKFRSTAEVATDGIIIGDRNAYIIFLNNAAKNIFGYDEKEILGKPVSILMPERFREYYNKGMEKARQSNKIHFAGKIFEFIGLRKDGAEFPAEISFGYWAKNGEIFYVSILRDITARKKMEETLKESEEKYRAIVDNSHSGILIIGEDFRFIYVNDKMCEILGYPREELIGHDFSDFLDEESRKLVVDRYVKRQQREEDVPSMYEFNIVRKDGKKRRVEISSAAVTDSKGTVKTIAQISDITERKQAGMALRESEERFRRFFENLGDAVFVTKLSGKKDRGRILEVNPAAERQTGYRRSELLSMNIATDIAVKDTAEIRFDEWNNKLLSGKKVKTLEKKMRKDGSEYWTEVVVTPIEYKGEKATLSINRDITERKLAEKALWESEDRYRSLINDVLDSSDVGLFILDRDFKVVWINQAIERYFGIRREAVLRQDKRGLIKKRIKDIFSDSDGFAKKVFATYDDNTYTENFECHILPAGNREERWLEHWSQPIKSGLYTRGRIEHYYDITERKRSEKALRESEIKFRLLADYTFDWEYWIDEQGNYIYISPSCERITGYSPQEFISNPQLLFEIVKPGYAEKVHHHYFDEKSKDVQVFSMKFPITTRTGEVRWLEHNCTPVYDEQGKFSGRRGNNRDITERRRAEMIQNAEYKITRAMATAIDLQSLFAIVRKELADLVDTKNFILALYNEKSGMLHTVFDRDEKDAIPAYWKADKSLTGSMVLGKKPVLLKKKEINGLIEKAVIEHIGTIPEVWLGIPLLTGETAVGAIVIQNYNQAEAYDKTTVQMLEVIAHGLGIFINRKQTEAERERLSMAIEQSAEGVIITDSQGNIQYVNPAFERITGYSRAEALGQTPRILNSGQHDHSFYKELWDTITAGSVWHGKIFNRRKDGNLFTEEVTISPVLDTAGKIANYVAVQRDITKEEELEQQFRQAQKMESVGRLAGGVAHDFNNMLGVILGYSELVLAALDPADKMYKDIQEIYKAGQRSADLTMQLLAFSRKQTIAPEVLDLNERVSNMIKMLTRLIGEDIELVFKPGSGLGKTKIDPTQIDQILANLCVNARDAISGNGTLVIKTENVTLDETYSQVHTYAKPGAYIKLTISDDGCGMDKDTQLRIFEPFFTTKAQGEGTGLGLSTVYGIVKQNDGIINIYSEPGHGTSFKIYFAQCEEADVTIKTVKEKEMPAGHGEVILLVEDELAILEMFKSMLQNIHYKVLAANSPQQALSIASEQRKIDLLMTDVVMPGMNGKALAQQLKPMFPEMKLLFMSGYTADIIATRGVLEAGVNFISKPFSLPQLALKLQKTLKE